MNCLGEHLLGVNNNPNQVSETCLICHCLGVFKFDDNGDDDDDADGGVYNRAPDAPREHPLAL